MKRNSKLIILPVLFYLLTTIIYLFAGDIHSDEAAYLYAAQNVYHGKLLYKDFFFLQPPIYPYIYGAVQLIKPGFLTGRLTSIFWGMLSTILLYLIARKLGNPLAGFMTVCLISSNLFQLYFFVVTRLYALTCALLCLACYLLIQKKKPDIIAGVGASFVLTLALWTRLTVLPAVCIGIVYLIIRGKDFKTKIISVTIPCLVTLGIYFLITQNLDSEQLYFNLLGMNLSLHANNLSQNIMQKFHATTQLIQFYFFPILLSLPLLFNCCIHMGKNFKNHSIASTLTSLLSPKALVWTIALSIFVLHYTAKIYQVSYQTIVMPIILCLICVEWSHIFLSQEKAQRSLLSVLFFSGCILMIFSYGRTSIHLIEGKPAYMALKQQADWVRNHTSPDDVIFSADSALIPLESGRDILTGMAGSDLFGAWSTEKCRKYRVLNFEIMAEYIQNQSGKVLIYGDKSFTLSLPYLEPISDQIRTQLVNKILEYYTVEKSFPNLFIPGTYSHYCIKKESL